MVAAPWPCPPFEGRRPAAEPVPCERPDTRLARGQRSLLGDPLGQLDLVRVVLTRVAVKAVTAKLVLLALVVVVRV